MITDKPFNQTRLQIALRQADELKDKKKKLEARLKAELEALSKNIHAVERKVESIDVELETHGLCSLATLLIKKNPGLARTMLNEAAADPSTPAGHVEAVRYALKNRKVQ